MAEPAPKRDDLRKRKQYRINLIRAVLRAYRDVIKQGLTPTTLLLSCRDLVELSCGVWDDAGNDPDDLPDLSQYLHMEVVPERTRPPGRVYVQGKRKKEKKAHD